MLIASALPTDHVYLTDVINFHWDMATRSHLGDCDLPRSPQNLPQIRRKCPKTSRTREPAVCDPLIGFTRTQVVYISGFIILLISRRDFVQIQSPGISRYL